MLQPQAIRHTSWKTATSTMPCVIRLFIRSFDGHHRVPHSKSDVHSHQVKTRINITHIRGILLKKIHVSREQTKITSNIASFWCVVMYSSNPGLTKVLSGGQVITPRFFPRAGYGNALVIPDKERGVHLTEQTRDAVPASGFERSGQDIESLTSSPMTLQIPRP